MSRIASEIIYKLIADETDLVKGLKTSEKKIDETAKKFTETGKKLTLGLTVPIVGVGVAISKMAAELQDSENAVRVIFGEGAKVVEDYGKKAAEAAGLSVEGFNAAASSIGVLLKQTSDDMPLVAQQTVDLTQRAADLASLLGGTTTDAANALGAALRGESEPARRFGVILSENAVQAKAAQLGLGGLKGELTEGEKVQARYALIMEQSAQAAGDFANTSDGAKNSAAVLKANIANLAGELGRELLPLVEDVLLYLRNIAKGFSELDKGTKQTILVVGGLAAAIGPLVVGLGQAISAIGTLKTAAAALSAVGGGPIALAIAGVAGLAVAVKAFFDNIEAGKKQQADIGKILGGGTTGKVADDLKIINSEIETYYAKIASSSGLVPGETAEYEKQVAVLITKRNELIKLQQWQTKTTTDLAAIAEKERKAAEEKAKKEVASAETTERYKKARESIVGILDSEKSEYDKILEKIRELEATPWASGKLEEDRKAAVSVLYAKLSELEDARMKEVVDSFNEQTQKDREATEKRIEELRSVEDAARDAMLERRRLEDEHEARKQKAHEDELKRIADEKQAAIDSLKERIAISAQLFSTLTGIINQAQSNELQGIENNFTAQKNAILETTLSEEEKAEKLKALDKEKNIEIARARRKQAEMDKAAALVDVAINTASAIVKALPNIPLSIAVGALGAAQALVVASQPLPEIPKFAQGGSFMVPSGFNADNYPIPAAMVQSGERVTIETPEQQRANDRPVFQIGTVIADPSGLRELDRLLRKYGVVEDMRLANG